MKVGIPGGEVRVLDLDKHGPQEAFDRLGFAFGKLEKDNPALVQSSLLACRAERLG